MKNKVYCHRQIKRLLTLSVFSLLVACASNTPPNTKTEPSHQSTKQTAQTVQTPTTKVTPRKNDPSKVSAKQNHERKLASLNGHKTTNSRVLAAGGYITGALGGS